MKRLFCSTTFENKFAAELTMTLLRVFVGLALAFGHGLGKLPPGDGFVAGVGALGFPVPIAFAWAAGFAEFVGGLFLALGLLTRPAALAVAFTMAVAAFGQHANDPFKVKELALTYFFVALVFTVRGSGKFSFDRFLA